MFKNKIWILVGMVTSHKGRALAIVTYSFTYDGRLHPKVSTKIHSVTRE